MSKANTTTIRLKTQAPQPEILRRGAFFAPAGFIYALTEE